MLCKTASHPVKECRRVLGSSGKIPRPPKQLQPISPEDIHEILNLLAFLQEGKAAEAEAEIGAAERDAAEAGDKAADAVGAEAHEGHQQQC
jgi:hypothetical protein